MQAHQSRFKAYLVSSEQQLVETSTVKDAYLWVQRHRQVLQSVDEVMIFVLMYLELRNPSSWAMSSGQSPLNPCLASGPKIKELSEPFYFLKRFENCLSVREIFYFYRPRKLPQAVFEVLWKWAMGDYRLILMDRAPTPLEMLARQSQGQRVVSLSWMDAIQATSIDGRRDAFEFLLHDLIHADLFFKDPACFLEQKFFFTQLKSVVESENLLVRGDSQFLESLSYLMSDMNSHKAHLEAHWQAILIQWQLRKENKRPDELLSPKGASWVQSLVDRVRITKCAHSEAAPESGALFDL